MDDLFTKSEARELLQTIPSATFRSAKDRMLGQQRPDYDPSDRVVFGVNYLDKALGGIRKNDLVLITAESGAGKTQFVTNIALANIKRGKRVHFIALEAYEGEIEDRIEYNRLANRYFNDPGRKYIKGGIRFADFVDGKCNEVFANYHTNLTTGMNLENLQTFYRKDGFDIESMRRVVGGIAEQTDLVIIDHIHYFDYDEDQQNKALKFIAKEARDLALNHGVPIMLVAHIRKQDLKNKQIAPNREDIHGSGDLSKIATAVITIGKGDPRMDGKFITYFRIAKSRVDGGLDRYVAMTEFNSKLLQYDEKFQLGKATHGGTKFGLYDETLIPEWAK